jgi:hypothetical protein
MRKAFIHPRKPEPMKKAIKLAVFDLAGTTIKDNSNVAGSFQHAFLNHGFENVTLGGSK